MCMAALSKVPTTISIYSATLYDYTNGRAIIVQGIPLDQTTASATVANIQPFSTVEEFNEAIEIARVNKSDETAFAAMPSFITKNFAN